MTVEDSTEAPSWFTFCIENGEVKFDQVYLTGVEAHERAAKLCRARKDAYAAEAPECEEDPFCGGPFAVIELVGPVAIVRSAGLRHRDAQEEAEYVMENFGPGKQQVKREVVDLGDGRKKVRVSAPPVVRAVHIVNLPFEQFRIIYPA